MRSAPALVIAFALVLPACGEGEGAPAPPAIALGRDMCVECGMIISDPAFAAAYEVDGADRIFDDIGDMVAYGLRTGELTATTPAWVHDQPTATWIEASAAWFVVDTGTATPMGHDLVAFAEYQAALSLADDHGGRLLSWDAVLAEHAAPTQDHTP